MGTIIKNGFVLNADFRTFTKTDLKINGEWVASIGDEKSVDEVFDASGLYVLPGLIDTHTHGANGTDFFTKKDLSAVRKWYAAHGVTTILPTLASHPIAELITAERHVVQESKKRVLGAAIGGIHLEGPFLSMEKKGAIVLTHEECTVEQFGRMYDAAEGLLRVMTIAPERENAMEVISAGHARGVRMSLGHTVATYGQTMAAIKAGATGATHTFNAMRPLHHRESGVLGAVLTDARVLCEAICDEIHLSPAIIKLMYKAKGAEGMIIISDSVETAGLPDGEYLDRQGRKRTVTNGKLTLADGTIAGSCFSVARGARNLAAMGISLCDIARMGAWNPACAVGINAETGSLEVGKCADILICDSTFHIVAVFARGQRIPNIENE